MPATAKTDQNGLPSPWMEVLFTVAFTYIRCNRTRGRVSEFCTSLSCAGSESFV